MMLTLTYADLDGWRGGHMTAFMNKLRIWYRGQTGFSLHHVWVLEMQLRGAPHYHIMLWVPPWLRLPFPDEGIRTPWWPHGTSNLKRNIRHHGAYLAKYIGKGNALPVPYGARTFGTSMEEEVRDARRWANAPGYVRAMIPRDDRISRRPRLHIPAGYRINEWLQGIGARVDEAGHWLGHKSGIYLLPIHRHRYHLFVGHGLRRFFRWLGANLAWTMPSEKTVAAMLAVHPDHLR